MTNTDPSIQSAVRIVNQNSCGSGTVVNNDYQGGSLILTNANVAGTRVGRTVQVDFQIGGNRVRKLGQIIMAAYSDRTLADWAIVHVPNFQEVPAVRLSKNRPQGLKKALGQHVLSGLFCLILSRRD